MPGTCPISWQTDACYWDIGFIWRSWDMVERGIFIALALMLGYTAFVVFRFARLYPVARRESGAFAPDSRRAFRRSQRTLVGDLSRGLPTLKAISSAAPFLGLAGTSYGILLGLLFGSMSASWSRFEAIIAAWVASALVTAAAGIFVAIPAILAHNFLRSRIELHARRRAPENLTENHLGSFQFAQTLPLKRRFTGLPAFALVAAPVVACALMVYMGFRAYPMPTGLRVHLLPIGTLRPRNGSTDKVTVSMLSRRDAQPIVQVNSENIPLDHLEDAVRARLRPPTSCQAYVEADSDVYLAYVADVIDRIKKLHCQVFLLTTMPAPEVKHGSRHRAKIPIARP